MLYRDVSTNADYFRVCFGIWSLVFKHVEPSHLELALVLEVNALDVADQPGTNTEHVILCAQL